MRTFFFGHISLSAFLRGAENIHEKRRSVGLVVGWQAAAESSKRSAPALSQSPVLPFTCNGSIDPPP